MVEIFKPKIGQPKIGRNVWFHETVEKMKQKFKSKNRSKYVFENGRFFEKVEI